MFKVGEAVAPKSGGYLMTVTYVDHDEPFVECTWFHSGQLSKQTFHNDELCRWCRC
jgi:uncharacterized protein YodC (DUF2158 family)